MKYIKLFENKKKVVQLEDLVGNHILSGVDVNYEDEGRYQGANYIVFILDGIKYKAIEDPTDGYRSCLDEIIICDDKVSNKFYPQEVIGKMNDEIIEFRDVENNEIVLQIGTDNEDSYYPSFIMNFTPENFELNKVANKYNL